VETVNLETKKEELQEQLKPQTQAKKSYSSPILNIYGRVERHTGGGSGMAKEVIVPAKNKFP
jgi:hypothetical protein